MQVVRHQSLLNSICDLSPNVSWLSAVVPKMLEGHDGAGPVDVACKDLALKVNQLMGEVLDLEGQVVDLESGEVLVVNGDQLEIVEAPTVIVVTKTGSLESLRAIEERLRTALAENIIALAEAQGIVPEEVPEGAIDDTTKEMFVVSPKNKCDGCATGEVAANAGLPCPCPIK